MEEQVGVGSVEARDRDLKPVDIEAWDYFEL
jgi:hypothetical protein